jgi:hypothetical protein
MSTFWNDDPSQRQPFPMTTFFNDDRLHRLGRAPSETTTAFCEDDLLQPPSATTICNDDPLQRPGTTALDNDVQWIPLRYGQHVKKVLLTFARDTFTVQSHDTAVNHFRRTGPLQALPLSLPLSASL